jgi:hypothetical protein
MKELTDTASVNAFRQKFEAGRSFDLDDDLEFCPALLTESDVSIRPSPVSEPSPTSGCPLTSMLLCSPLF